MDHLLGESTASSSWASRRLMGQRVDFSGAALAWSWFTTTSRGQVYHARTKNRRSSSSAGGAGGGGMHACKQEMASHGSSVDLNTGRSGGSSPGHYSSPLHHISA